MTDDLGSPEEEESGGELAGELAKRWFDALLRESDQVQATITRTLTAAHNTVGIFIPAALGVFVLTAKALEASSKIDLLALVLAGVFCMARLYADSLWVEFLGYHHYFYGELQPRIYQAAGHKADSHMETPNLGEFVVKHWARRNGPHLVAPHVASFLLVAPLTIYGVWAYSSGSRRIVFLISVLFLLSAAILSSARAAWLSRTVYRALEDRKCGAERVLKECHRDQEESRGTPLLKRTHDGAA